MRILIAMTFLSLWCLPVVATPWRGDEQITAMFTKHKVQGVLVIMDDNKGQIITNDKQRSQQGFIPASTFKIPHSLLLLEAGVVKDERTQFVWDGIARDYQPWNRDHTFSSAMKYSVVPIYQELALKLGEQRMRQGLQQLAYGNADIGGGLDRFWLEGKLAISAEAQVRFLRRLYHNQLPLSERSQRIVKTMMLNEANDGWVLRAKTGYGVRKEMRLGWWVGWLEREDNCYFFALNMDIATDKDLALRKTLVRNVFKAKGWM